MIPIKLIKKELVAEETMAFHFEKPSGFEFLAGQYGSFTLQNPSETDEEGNKREFSIAGAPFETDLMIATRLRNTAFKMVLKNLPLGSEVMFDGPKGNFTLHKTATTPAVFLTGGIGITTARSIIAQATNDKLPHKITLFYLNRLPQDAAFLDDLRRFSLENQNFSFVPVMTRANPDNWSGESGHLTKEMLTKYIKDPSEPIYYLSGPSNMVAAMRKLLSETSANEDNIRTEEYSGY